MKGPTELWLTVIGAGANEPFVRIGRDPVLIGRDPQCHLRLSDPQASRRHARILKDGECIVIEDLGSRNGTAVNGRQIDRAPLTAGDVVRLGGTEVRVEPAENDAAPPDEAWTTAEEDSITVDAESLAAFYPGSRDPSSLRRAHADLGILYRIGQAISDTLDVESLVARILDTLLYEMPRIGRASVYLRQAGRPDLACAGFRARHLQADREPAVSQTMAHRVLANRQAVLTFDALHDQRFQFGESILAQGIRAAMCAPLLCRDRVIGVVYVDAVDAANRFEEDDLKLVAAIGQQVAVAIDNARLVQQLAAEKAALEQANQALQAAQEQLVHSAKMAVVGQMASGIVHDLKNPLAVLQLTHHMLRELRRRSTPLPAFIGRLNELVDDLGAGLRQCKDVVETLLQFGRPSELARTETSLPALITDTIRFLRHKTGEVGVLVETDLDPEMPPVCCDPGRITQVLVNLLLNALQALDKSPKQLSVSAGVASPPEDHLAFIRVEDNGRGMTPEQKERMFDPFFTTKEPASETGGAGLGLSISAGIIESHHGRIAVDSRLGQGTTVTVYLPLAGREK